MRGVRGAEKLPGEVRRSQNWIGGSDYSPRDALYVPPPPDTVHAYMDDLMEFANRTDIPVLIQAAVAHAQFESIHPFTDGNGRIGRLLVTLLLEHWKLLIKPLLYLSLYFKRNREGYYRRLNAVRIDGDWEGWLDFFLDGVGTIADDDHLGDPHGVEFDRQQEIGEGQGRFPSDVAEDRHHRSGRRRVAGGLGIVRRTQRREALQPDRRRGQRRPCRG